MARLPEAITGGLEIVAVRALGNAEDARDAVQEALVRALAAIRNDRVPPGVPLEAFVYGIARHVIVDVQRRRCRDRAGTGDADAVATSEPSALEALVREEERAMVAHALAKLSPRDRELLELCFVEGERVSAIAARLKEPADRVRKRKSRALERLREGLRSRAGHGMAPSPTIAT